MHAKDAIIAEMGDLFSDNPAVIAKDESEKDVDESFIVSEDDTTFDNATIWDESESEDTESDAKQTGEMTVEEIDACIEAAEDAMTDTKMSPEIFDWGLDFIKKMSAEKIAQIKAKIESIDWDAARERWAKEEEEEEEQERAEKEKFLHR